VTAWTDENPGRRFHGCGRFFLRKKCNFFRWFDPEVPDRQKKIIKGLLKKNNEFKKKEKKSVESDSNISGFVGVECLCSKL